jgi:hypothetical protein
VSDVGWVGEQAWVSGSGRCAHQHVDATFFVHALVQQMRAGPHPQVAAPGLGLVSEVDAGEHGERERLCLPGDAVAIEVSTAGFVVPPVDAGCDLNVVEGEVDCVRCHKLACQGENAAITQRS